MALASHAQTVAQARPVLLIITPVDDGKLPIPYLGSLFGTFEEMQRQVWADLTVRLVHYGPSACATNPLSMFGLV